MRRIIYCWVVEREVEVDRDGCHMRFGKGEGTVTAGCPWWGSWMCPVERKA